MPKRCLALWGFVSLYSEFGIAWVSPCACGGLQRVFVGTLALGFAWAGACLGGCRGQKKGPSAWALEPIVPARAKREPPGHAL